jgi:neutral ceramidase
MPRMRQPLTRLFPYALVAALCVFGFGVSCKSKKVVGSPDGGEAAYVPADHNTPNQLKAGAGEQILALPVGHSTAGYAQSRFIGSPTPSDDTGSPYADLFPATRGLYAPPAAKVVVLDNRDGPADTHHSRMVIAKIDAIGTTDVLSERVVQLAKERLNEDIAGELLLNATHTHDAGSRFSRTSLIPNIIPSDVDPKYFNALAHGLDTYSQESTDRVAGSIVDALQQALAGLKPAKFGYASGTNGDAAHDRRCENDYLYGPNYTDKKVTVMRVDDATTGDPIAVMFNYAQHGTIYGANNRNLSVDAPGHSEYMVEEQFAKPVVAMFIQGNAADVSPDGRGNDGSQAMQAAGYSLAQTVKATYDTIQTKAAVPLQVLSRWSPIGYSLLGYKPGEFYQDGAILCFQLFGNLKCPPGGEHTPADITDTNQNICTAQAIEGGGKYHTRFAAARIDDLAIITMPGESSTKLGENIVNAVKTVPGIKDAFVMGYALDHNGYMMVDDDWLSGGYEPTITFWGWKFARYAGDQGVDLFNELMTGTAAKKLPATVPSMAADPYTPIVPSDSMAAPAISTDVPTTPLARLNTINVSFHGGDPGLGTPLVSLQGKGANDAFADVKTNGWIPVSNLHGYAMQTFYEATPTFKANPTATSRAHLWRVQYEAPQGLPLGTYRFHVTGKANMGGTATAYELTSSAFQVVASTALTLDTKVAANGKTIVIDATLKYPQGHPTYANAPSGDWQLTNFRLWTPRWGNGFSPARPAALLPSVSATADGTSMTTAALSYEERTLDTSHASYQPGEGSGLHAEIAVPASGQYTVTVPTITDEFGNTSAPVTLMAPVP